jgi:transposase
MRKSLALPLAPGDRERLEHLIAAPATPQKVVWRARIILLASAGLGTREVSRQVGKSKEVVRRWRERYGALGVDGLLRDATRPSRKPPLAPETIKRVVDKTLHERPPGATHWTVRTAAAATGVSPAAIHRIWRAHGLKPHLIRRFKLSNDPHFNEKVEDVVGLYLDPPEGAIVLSVDEKSQIQALDRTQPGLPMKKGRAGTMTHDYKRNGTTTLFAALNIATGEVIGSCMKRHRHQEYLAFLRTLDRRTPKRLDLHIIADNYATHKHTEVKKWLEKHPRFRIHFTPTSASWLNLVERFFAEITDRRIRRGVFKSVQELEAAINEYIQNRNAEPKPFVWNATAHDILKKVARGRQALESVH